MKQYKLLLLIPFLLLILAEVIWSWRKDKKVYDVKETFANLAILAGFNLSKFLFAGYQLAILGLSADFAPIHLSHNAWTFTGCFLLADLAYHWFHRVSHSWKPLCAFHLIHHSSMHMNLSTAYRLNWFGALISPVFFVPLALAGFPPDFIVASYGLNLLYQFFLHTEAVGQLGPLEGIIDTPSAHRVHHGSNPIYIDKNFGGVLICRRPCKYSTVFRVRGSDFLKELNTLPSTAAFSSSSPSTSSLAGAGSAGAGAWKGGFEPPEHKAVALTSASCLLHLSISWMSWIVSPVPAVQLLLKQQYVLVLG